MERKNGKGAGGGKGREWKEREGKGREGRWGAGLWGIPGVHGEVRASASHPRVYKRRVEAPPAHTYSLQI